MHVPREVQTRLSARLGWSCGVTRPFTCATINYIFFSGALSRVMTRPVRRVRSNFKNPRVESGRVKRCWKSHGSGRVGSGRARRFSKITGSGRLTLTLSDPREEIRPVKKALFCSRVLSRYVLRYFGRTDTVGVRVNQISPVLSI